MDRYAACFWPEQWSYPIVYRCEDGGFACAECVNDVANRGWVSEQPGSRVVAGVVYYQGALQHCANCNAEIRSLLGEMDHENKSYGLWQKAKQFIQEHWGNYNGQNH